MVRYDSEVHKEAVDFIEEFMDDVVEALKNDENYLLDGDLNDTFFEMITDRSYTLSDAAFVIDNSNNVETDSGLWEGKDPQDAVEIQAAFTYSNDVHSEVEEIYEDLKSTYDDNYGEVYDELMEKHKDDVKADPDDDDYDATDDAEEAAVLFTKEYFESEYGDTVPVVTDKKDQIYRIERYLTMAKNVSREDTRLVDHISIPGVVLGLACLMNMIMLNMIMRLHERFLQSVGYIRKMLQSILMI
jgi:hypothetical protein